MTVQEFSDGFDTLLSSFVRSGAYGENLGLLEFDEYEKSLFLTTAQEQLVISIYNGRSSEGISFESSEETRRYLEPLVMDASDTTVDASDHVISSDSYVYKLPADLWFLVYEAVDWSSGDVGCLPYQGIQVVPVRHDEYHRLRRNPFRGANDNRVLRLDGNNNTGSDNQYVELVSKYPIARYQYRYVRKPRPIVLAEFEDVSVGGAKTPQTSELHEALHGRILDLGVQLAMKSRTGIGDNTGNNQYARGNQYTSNNQ